MIRNGYFSFHGFPQIKMHKQTNTRFHRFPNHFLITQLKVFIENKFAGFFIFSVHKGHLKTLYFNLPEGIENEIANFLKIFCKQHQIEIITVYYFEVAGQLFARKFPFLHMKKYGQKIYSSFKIDTEKEYHFHDGDGDGMFT